MGFHHLHAFQEAGIWELPEWIGFEQRLGLKRVYCNECAFMQPVTMVAEDEAANTGDSLPTENSSTVQYRGLT